MRVQETRAESWCPRIEQPSCPSCGRCPRRAGWRKRPVFARSVRAGGPRKPGTCRARAVREARRSGLSRRRMGASRRGSRRAGAPRCAAAFGRACAPSPRLELVNASVSRHASRGTRRAMIVSVLARLKDKWRTFKAHPAGERFQTIHRQQAGASRWLKAAMIAGAVIAFAVGIVLTVLPGPAVVFFALAGALAAVLSAWVARALARAERAVRRVLHRLRRRLSPRRAAATLRKHGTGA